MFSVNAQKMRKFICQRNVCFKGPFRSIFLNVEDYAKASRPMLKNSLFISVTYTTNETGTVMLYGNFTVLYWLIRSNAEDWSPNGLKEILS